jgi:protein-S-isoprenylcysteine O-methyltransferase Ste14
MVRHPIYTGVLLAMLGTAIGCGRPLSLLGAPIAFAAFWKKARMEEQFMTEQFGAQYTQYQRAVRAFIPGLF